MFSRVVVLLACAAAGAAAVWAANKGGKGNKKKKEDKTDNCPASPASLPAPPTKVCGWDIDDDVDEILEVPLYRPGQPLPPVKVLWSRENGLCDNPSETKDTTTSPDKATTTTSPPASPAKSHVPAANSPVCDDTSNTTNEATSAKLPTNANSSPDETTAKLPTTTSSPATIPVKPTTSSSLPDSPSTNDLKPDEDVDATVFIKVSPTKAKSDNTSNAPPCRHINSTAPQPSTKRINAEAAKKIIAAYQPRTFTLEVSGHNVLTSYENVTIHSLPPCPKGVWGDQMVFAVHVKLVDGAYLPTPVFVAHHWASRHHDEDRPLTSACGVLDAFGAAAKVCARLN